MASALSRIDEELEPGAGESGEADDEERAQELCGGGPEPAKKTDPAPCCPLLCGWCGDISGSWAETGVAGCAWCSGTGDKEACGCGDIACRLW